MSDSRKIRVDVLEAAIQGVAAGAVMAIVVGALDTSGAKGVSSALQTLSDNYDRLVEESEALDEEEDVALR